MRHTKPEWYELAHEKCCKVAGSMCFRHSLLSFDDCYAAAMAHIARLPYDPKRATVDLESWFVTRAFSGIKDHVKLVLGKTTRKPGGVPMLPIDNIVFAYEPIADVERSLDFAKFRRYTEHQIGKLIWTDKYGSVVLKTTIRGRRIMRQRLFEEESLKTIANREDISIVRVHQIIKEGLRQLRDQCRPYYELCVA